MFLEAHEILPRRTWVDYNFVKTIEHIVFSSFAASFLKHN